MAGVYILTEPPISSTMIVVLVSKMSQGLSDGAHTNGGCCMTPVAVVGCLYNVLIAGDGREY
jgi:hypothetical protein